MSVPEMPGFSKPTHDTRQRASIAADPRFLFYGATLITLLAAAVAYYANMPEEARIHLNSDSYDGHDTDSHHGHEAANDNNTGDPEYGRCPAGGYHDPYITVYGNVEILKCRKCESLLAPLF